MSKRVALYARSSNDAHDVSCQSQLREFQTHADEAGEVVVEQREERAVSHFEAQGFMELITMAQRTPRPFDKVYVYDTSRISRDQIRQAVLIREMERAGVEIHFIKLPTTNNEMADMMLRSIFGIFDQLHSKRSAQGAISGMKENIRQGYRAGGAAPYGYKLKKEVIGNHRDGHQITKSRLAIDPEKAPIIREIFERLARRESYASIADKLTERRVPRARKRAGTQWNSSAVRNLLNNWRIYLGWATWNKANRKKFERKETKELYRDESEWLIIKDNHPAILDEELVQRTLDNHPSLKNQPVRRRSDNPLRGLLYCGLCNSRVHSWGKGQMKCAKTARGECSAPSITTSRVVSSTLKGLRSLLKPGVIDEIADRIVAITKEQVDTVALDKQIADLRRRTDNLETALEVAESSSEVIRLQQQKLNPLYIQIDKLSAQRDIILSQSSPALTKKEVLRELHRVIDKLEQVSIDSPPEELRELLAAVIRRITYYPAKTEKARSHLLEIEWLPGIIAPANRGKAGDPKGNRTPAAAVKGQCPNR